MDTRYLFRGDIVIADLEDRGEDSFIQRGRRPCLILNTAPSSNVAVVIPMTSKLNKKDLWFHIRLEVEEVIYGRLSGPSLLLPEQITTIDKSQILGVIGRVSSECGFMERVDDILIKLLCCERAA